MIVATADGRSTRAESALGRALELIRPDDVTFFSAEFQFLLELDDEYDAVRRRSSNRLLQDLMPNEGAYDWSVLLDGDSERLNVPYQVEFGIISREEAPLRLVQQVGRLEHEATPPLPLDFWRVEEAPACGLFMDWRWLTGGRMGTTGELESVMEGWTPLADESGRIASEVHDRLQEGAHWREEAAHEH